MKMKNNKGLRKIPSVTHWGVRDPNNPLQLTLILGQREGKGCGGANYSEGIGAGFPFFGKVCGGRNLGSVGHEPGRSEECGFMWVGRGEIDSILGG